MAAVPRREGMATPSSAAQKYMGVAELASCAASLCQRQLGTAAGSSFGATCPHAGPATTALLPGRVQLPCGSHQSQLWQGFPEGWVICLPCFACLRLPQEQGDVGCVACPVRVAVLQPPPQGRAGGQNQPHSSTLSTQRPLPASRKGGGGCGEGSGNSRTSAVGSCFRLSAFPGNKQLKGPL